MIKMKAKKIVINIARAAVCAGAAALGFYLLWCYEYITQAPQIDNIVGGNPHSAGNFSGCRHLFAGVD